MGRLIRKKTTIKKKSKNPDLDASASVEKGADSIKSSAPSRDAKAKTILPLMKKSSAGTKTSAGKQKKNFIDKSLQFLREVKIELKKVTWPSRKQTLGSTVVVIVLVMIISLFLGMADFGLSSLIRVVLR
jgi:preprotein translocase subunit SecE